MFRNYYQILGLSPDCSKDDIKKAFRMYATKFHPDKQNNDKFFEDRFKEIKEAYDILVDDDKRARYDSEYLQNKFPSNYKDYLNNQDHSKFSSRSEFLQENERKNKEKWNRDEEMRRNVYYTSENLVLNGLEIKYFGRSYKLSGIDKSTIKKDDNSYFVRLGIVLVIIGVITMMYFIGIFLLIAGIYVMFYREYFIVLAGKNGEIRLIKGQKQKMIIISRLINRSIKENT